ncbi:MAG: hypothetical protein Q7S85_00145 [Rugosibacter sp.]|nr:hypothetical protein [Rugosibacter sp.]
MSDTVSITIRQEEGYKFLVDFGAGLPPLIADEPEPLGGGEGPDPSHILLAGVANCLAASLLFALKNSSRIPAGSAPRPPPSLAATKTTGYG